MPLQSRLSTNISPALDALPSECFFCRCYDLYIRLVSGSDYDDDYCYYNYDGQDGDDDNTDDDYYDYGDDDNFYL